MANRKRRCRQCKEYKPVEDMVIINNAAYCNMDHALEYGKSGIQKQIKKKHAKQKREFYENDIKTRREAAVREFNKYIRLRDADKPCISCGAPAGSFTLTAGHYITAGSCSALRFDERNCAGQCWWNCNKNKSGNIVGYRAGILDRYGQEEGQKILDYLEGAQPTINISVDWYRSIEEKYKKLCKELEG